MEPKPRRRKTPLQAIDRRTEAGRHVDAVREKLANFVGGEPNIAEREIIDRAAMLSLQITQLERKIAAGDDLTEKDSNIYLNWTNFYCRILKFLPRRETESVNA